VKLKIAILILTIIAGANSSSAKSFTKIEPLRKVEFSTERIWENSPSFGGGQGEAFDFRYNDRKRGIKPYIAPVLLISAGTVLHFSTEAKENFQDWVQENTSYTSHLENYLQYAPLAVVYGLNAVGVKGKNNFGNRTAIVIKSLVLNDLMVSSLKTRVGEKRPSGGTHSFPSGHTSVAFALAQFMHHEYGDESVWYSVGAYSCATTVGIMRVAGNAHWISDVVASAGFGMLSTELVYLTHQYKWDKEHLRRLDIFPWSNQKQKGVALVYTF
jgi:hypothetical protein